MSEKLFNEELDLSKLMRIEAYYSHGMSWDIDDICKDFDLNKTKHIESVCVGKWAELHIFLNDEGLQAIKDNVTNAEYEKILEDKILTVSGAEWTDDYKWPTNATYWDKNWNVLEEETF